MAKTFTLPTLPYAYEALEPHIHRDIMQLHHSKHHQAYVTNLNAALLKQEKAAAEEDLRGVSEANYAARFNAGGHFNHTLFWSILAPKEQGGGTLPTGLLLQMVEKQYGSMQAMIEQFNAEALAIQGSGWGWLAFDLKSRALTITTSPNQDPLRPTSLHPLLNVDVWEHAYYLQYKNARGDYLKAIWEVIHWSAVEQRLMQMAQG